MDFMKKRKLSYHKTKSYHIIKYTPRFNIKHNLYNVCRVQIMTDGVRY